MDVVFREPVGSSVTFCEYLRPNAPIGNDEFRRILTEYEGRIVQGFKTMEHDPAFAIAVHTLEIHTAFDWLLLHSGGIDLAACGERTPGYLDYILHDLCRDMREARDAERDETVPIVMKLALYGIRDTVSRIIQAKDPFADA